jgi:hypothetical protein
MYVKVGLETCGSKPAREEVITFDINVDRTTAFASRLAPTWIALGASLTCEKPLS